MPVMSRCWRFVDRPHLLVARLVSGSHDARATPVGLKAITVDKREAPAASFHPPAAWSHSTAGRAGRFPERAWATKRTGAYGPRTRH